jgi:3-dehydroquinate synthase
MPPRDRSRPGAARRARRIILRTGSGESHLHCGPGLLDDAGALLAARVSPGPAAVVTTRRVARLYGARLLRSLRRAGFRPAAIVLPDGERAKSIAVAAALYRAFVRARLDRGSPVVALGGGAVGDVAGFAAATYLRGVPFVAAPTTLLAQVDASVGGKTAVNLPEGKNLVGAFHQPILVLADTSALATLGDRDFRSGVAEIVKVAAVLDAALFRLLERRADAVLARDAALIADLVARAVRWKARVVAEDERDTTGRRALLNYGHTVGHALEAAARFRALRHGEAVAIGIVAASRLAAALGILAAGDAARQEALIRRLGLPTRVPPGTSLAAVLAAIGRDKKVSRGRPAFVLTPQVGSGRLAPLISTRTLSRVLVELGCGRRGGVR